MYYFEEAMKPELAPVLEYFGFAGIVYYYFLINLTK